MLGLYIVGSLLMQHGTELRLFGDIPLLAAFALAQAFWFTFRLASGIALSGRLRRTPLRDLEAIHTSPQHHRPIQRWRDPRLAALHGASIVSSPLTVYRNLMCIKDRERPNRESLRAARRGLKRLCTSGPCLEMIP